MSLRLYTCVFIYGTDSLKLCMPHNEHILEETVDLNVAEERWSCFGWWLGTNPLQCPSPFLAQLPPLGLSYPEPWPELLL